MSRYIQILNALKQNLVRLSLTPSQAECRIKILERLEYPGVLNLHGARGVGKTVLGWCLESEGHAVYVEDSLLIHAIEGRPEMIFIDNAGHRRDEYRRILDDLNHARIRKAVIVSRERIEDFVQAISISCVAGDVATAVSNLSRLGFPPVTPPDDTPFLDLWDVLQFSARREPVC